MKVGKNMKRADVNFVIAEKLVRNHRQRHTKKTLMGVQFDNDACTEHEVGINGLRELFGTLSDKVGVEKFFCTKHPCAAVSKEIVVDNRNGYILLYHPYGLEAFQGFTDEQLLRAFDLRPYDNKGSLYGAWDERSFGILAFDGDIKWVKEIESMILTNEMAIFMRRLREFNSYGLKLALSSFFNEEEKKLILEEDESKIQLLKATGELDLESVLRAKGKKWFALSPSWLPEERKGESKYPFMFWLNPYYQNVDKFGWFTVEQLLDWGDDKGIIKKTK